MTSCTIYGRKLLLKKQFKMSIHKILKNNWRPGRQSGIATFLVVFVSNFHFLYTKLTVQKLKYKYKIMIIKKTK